MFVGYALYGMSAVLLVLALRRSQLSLLYPVIALTFVWVAILSVIVFHETLTPMRIAGITTVVLGVGLLGFGESSPAESKPASAASLPSPVASSVKGAR
jgi:drug/metabolite transporter (DMT)-like permease